MRQDGAALNPPMERNSAGRGIVIRGGKFRLGFMLARLSFAHCLLLGGALLAVLSLVLWKCLPIAMSWPPFGLTALLALVAGAVDLALERRAPAAPPPPEP